jgi:hypothetical protein
MVGPAKRAYSYDLLIYGSEAGYLSSRRNPEKEEGPVQGTNLLNGTQTSSGAPS